MKSLFVRFFLSFWLIIGITIGAAAIGGFWYAERMRDAMESFELGDSMLDASAALDAGGREGLASWLKDFPQSQAVTIFVLDQRGHDILERRVPPWISRVFRRHRQHDHDYRRNLDEPVNLRRARPAPQLVTASGDTYTFFVMPSRIPDAVLGSTDARLLLLIFALLASGLVSYALASAISRPVRKLRDATVALADGDLNVRVADSIGKRRDEVGMLGREFDSMAEKLQRAALQQTELSRNISHELRSPLARMRVAVELAKRQAGELPEFDRLDVEAERLDSLIGQILSYTKLDVAPNQEPEPVKLDDLISEVVENVNYECKAEGISGVSVSSEIVSSPSICGYPGALVSAIENILRNAVRHSPPNSDVTIRLEQKDGEAIVKVADHGPGVDEDDLPELFKPFFRTRKSAESGRDHGTGLGLAIAERAVRMNGGRIGAENRVGGGLIVRIFLPVQKGLSS
jgi:two-component system sensor histidine kinase CpxA